MTENNSTEIQHAWSILTRFSAIDQETKLASMWGVLERLSLDQKQLEKNREKQGRDDVFVPFPFELITLWWRTGDTKKTNAQFKIEIVDPAGTALHSNERSLVFEEGQKRVRMKAKMDGLRVSTEGMYSFRVSLKEVGMKKFEVVGETPLEVKIADLSEKKE